LDGHIPNFCKAQEIYFMSVLAKNSPNYVISQREISKSTKKVWKRENPKLCPIKGQPYQKVKRDLIW
jgi:hypothetical protein